MVDEAFRKRELPKPMRRLSTPAAPRHGAKEPEEDHYDRVKAFLRNWSINTDNAADMMRCTLKQRDTVMAGFEPSDSNNDINVELNQWIWKVLQTTGPALPKAASPPPLPAASPPVSKRQPKPSFSPTLQPAATEMEEPAQHWEIPDLIEASIEEMGLNEKAASLLRELPVDQQEHAIASFEPSATTRDINGAFIALLKRSYGNRWHAHSASETVQPQGTSDPIEAFIQQMGLNEEAVSRLQELPVDQQMHAIASFEPNSTTRDVNGAFIVLLKRNYGDSRHAHSANGPVQPQRSPNPIEAFIEEMGLNEKAVTLLGELPVDQQMHAIASFQPTATTRDINGAFIALLKRNYGNSWYAHSAMKPVQPRRMPDPPVVKKARLY